MPIDQFKFLVESRSSPQTQVEPLYFNRPDVKKVIHVPDVPWVECRSQNRVFPDESLHSALTVLPNVIEKSKRTVIVHGLADYALIAEG